MPIATMASCVAIVAPMATSCNKGTSISHDYSKGVYEFSIEKPKYQGTESEILDKYFADINKNKKIFCQDYLAGGVWGITLGGVVKSGTMKVTVNSVNEKEHRVSFKLSISYTKESITAKIEYTVKNLIYSCYKGELLGEQGWFLEPDGDKLKTDSNWSVEQNLGGVKKTVNKDNLSEETILTVNKLVIISSYLDECTKA